MYVQIITDIARNMISFLSIDGVANFQDEVIADSLYKGILENVERHMTHEVLVEVALEIFIILSLNCEYIIASLLEIQFLCEISPLLAEMIQCLNDVDTLRMTVLIMKEHVTYSCKLIYVVCISS